MRIIKKTYDYDTENYIKDLACNLGISNLTAKILYGRGLDTVKKIAEFLSPSKQSEFSPFTLSGMEDAVRRICLAKDNNETVVVYGDYDADGVCATTLLYKSLKRLGLNVHAVIPERENGYGLTEGVLNEVLETLYPDLIITVDCGISCKNEVEYLLDLGVDVIVTDHHELPNELPPCVIVSTKTKGQEYPFEYLSGAGVAYKLASALIGDCAKEYLDLVAVSTVADNMVITGENRILVHKGLQLIKEGRGSKAISSLLIAGGAKEITSSSLAFTVAPRINAAGRMGDAYSALRLLITDDDKERDELVCKLVSYNVNRRVECEDLYKSAKLQLANGGNYGSVIVLFDNDWKNGLLGIVAARLTEEYNLPCILFSLIDGALHGSARSTEEINVYDAINSAKEFLIDYGGHAQAAGVTLKKENLESFALAVNDYLKSNYGLESFEKTVEIDGEIDEAFTLKNAREINLLEPFGAGNKKPLFLLKTKKAQVEPLKEGSAHLAIKTDKIELLYFNSISYLQPLSLDLSKNILFESSLSNFNGKEYVKGLVKGVVFEFENSCDFNLTCFKNALNCIKNTSSGIFDNLCDNVEEVINNTNSNGFGRLFIVTNPSNLKLFKGLSRFEICPLKLSVKGGKNAVLVGADTFLEDFSEYKELVFVDKPLGFSKQRGVDVVVGNTVSFDLSQIRTDKDYLRCLFKEIFNFQNQKLTGKDIALKFDNPNQIIFAIEVFKELNFISENGYVSFNKTEKKELIQSKIYSCLVGWEK